MDGNEATLLHELFFRSVEKFPERVAVTYSDNEEQSIDFCHLGKTVRNLSSCLKRILFRNEVVLVYSNQTVHLPAILLAVLDSSAAFYPVSTSVSPQMVLDILKKHSIRYILLGNGLDHGLMEQIEKDTCGTPRIVPFDVEDQELCESLNKVQVTLLKVMRTHGCIVEWKEDIAYVMQTSGTTGQPKAVFVPHSCILPNIVHLSSIFGVTCQDIVFLASPYTFDPFIVQMFLAFHNGASLLIVPDTAKLLPQFLCELLFDQHKVTIFQPTPSFLYYIGSDLIRAKILSENSTVSVLAIGGEACPPLSTLRKWKHPKCQTKLYNIYGITEVSSWATCYHITEEDLDKRNTDDQVDRLDHCPLGTPLAQTKLILYDDNGKILNGEGIGRLWIGGDDRKCLLEGEIPVSIPVMRDSGDIVEVRNGQMWYLGRSNNQLKRFGCLVNLEHIEKVVLQTTDVTSCAVVVQPIALGGGLIHLFVVRNKSVAYGTEVFVGELKKRLTQVLPRAAQPDTIHVVLKLPLTDHGKVNKHELLRSLDKDEVVEDFDIPIVDFLSKMWRRCCRKSNEIRFNEYATDGQVDGLICDDQSNSGCGYPKSEDMFITEGGDSFSAVQLADTIERWTRKRWGTSSDLSMLIDVIINRRFGELVAYVTKQVHEVRPVTDIILKSPSEPKGPLQDQDNYESTAKKLKTGEDGHSQLGVIVKRLKCAQGGPTSLKESRKKDRDHQHFAGHCSKRVFCSQCQKNNSFCLRFRPITIPWRRPNAQSSDQSDIGVEWKTCFGKCIDASPLVVISCVLGDGEVFIGSHSHQFMSVSLTNGNILWKTTLGGRVESSSCLSECGRMVIVGCYDSNIYVLARSNGAVIWTYRTGDVVKSSPCLDHRTGLVWVGSHDGTLYALDLNRKLCKTQVRCLEGSCFSSPFVCYQPHRVYIGTLAGRFLSVDAATGNITWCKKFDKPIFASPFAQDDNIYVATVDGSLKCFNHHGISLWEFCAAGRIFSSPVSYVPTGGSSDVRVVFASHDHFVYCISHDGKYEWSCQVDGPVYSTPCIVPCNVVSSETDGAPVVGEAHSCSCVVLVFTTKGTLHVLDSRDGSVLRTFSFPGEVFSSPAVVGQRVVVGCRDNYLYCLKLG